MAGFGRRVPTTCLRGLVCLMLLGGFVAEARAQRTIEGRVTLPDGTGISGVSVAISEIRRETVSGENGTWSLVDVPEGTYTLVYSLGDFTESQPITVTGTSMRIDRTVKWTVRFVDTIVVHGALRRNERLAEAPASASIIAASTIAVEGGHGELPKLLDAAPGVEVTQSGLFDFNLNVRGFNTLLNRRVLTLIDGRDPGGVLLGAQEWSAYAVAMDDIEQIEVIKGPMSALYGANAFNGIVSILTKTPRYNAGGRALITVGERQTFGLSAAHAGKLGKTRFFRLFGTIAGSDDFYVARTGAVEYPGLPTEAITPIDRGTVAAVAARIDTDVGNGGIWTIEGGTARVRGNIFTTGVGRIQNDSVHRPWARTNFQRGAWQVAGFADARVGASIALGSGATLQDRSIKVRGELLRRHDFVTLRARLIAGGSGTFTRIDTADDEGMQTILSDAQRAHQSSGFAQIDFDPIDDIRVVGAVRVDDASTHGIQASPKLGAAFHIRSDQTLRVSYGRGFQPASFGELFVRVPVAPPVALGAIESALAPALGGVRLGFESVPILALGNSALDVEHINSLEFGYFGVVNRRVLVSADYYRSRLGRFISALLPQIGTSLGRVNPAYGPYQPPSALGAQQRTLVIATLQAVLPPEVFAIMSNDADGAPIFVAASQTNVGVVSTQGLDTSVRYSPINSLTAELTYSWFDFRVRRDLPDDPLSANTSPHRVGFSIAYVSPRASMSMRYRHSESFLWASGIFRGRVPAFSVVDIAGIVKLTDRTVARFNVANLFDNRHFEMFGGDVLRRRAVLEAGVRW